MRVLVACEFSGIVRNAFADKGHYAVSCDILPTESDGIHYQCDIREILYNDWDMIIAHPPCTRMANSGVRWLHERNLWDELKIYADFFRMFLEHPCKKIAVENPVPHKYAIQYIGRKYDQVVQPYQFGHDASKKICLWLKNLPKLEPTNYIDKKVYSNQTPSGQNKLGPSPDRAKERSRFYEGIAKAMANQWG